MKKLIKIATACLFLPPLLAGCTTHSYTDAFANDNIYTADFYDNSPWWGGTYYTGYTWNNPGVYWGRDYGYWQNSSVRWGYDGLWNRDGSWPGLDRRYGRR